MTLPDRIAQARKLLEEITPGAWTARRIDYDRRLDASYEVCTADERLKLIVQTIMREIATEGAEIQADTANTEFIAAAPQLVRDLLAEIDRLQPYLQHRPECNIAVDERGEYLNCYRPIGGCDCGLSSLRDGQPA